MGPDFTTRVGEAGISKPDIILGTEMFFSTMQCRKGT